MQTSRKHISRRDFLKLIRNLTASLGMALFYGLYVEPGWAEVKEVHLKLPRLPAAFSGFRLAQISDLHFGTWMNRERFLPSLELIYAQKPDVIVITGDFVHGNWWQAFNGLAEVTETFQGLTQRIPTFAVLGNHDHWTSPEMVRSFLQESGIHELPNNIFTFEKLGQKLHLCGVDDIWQRKHRLKAVTDKLSGQDCAILLAHEPDFADESAASGFFDLQISGHSHSGQFIVPFYGPIFLPRLGKKYHSGLYQVGEMLQYTNRGLGMITPPIRINCRPEITVFTLL